MPVKPKLSRSSPRKATEGRQPSSSRTATNHKGSLSITQCRPDYRLVLLLVLAGCFVLFESFHLKPKRRIGQSPAKDKSGRTEEQDSGVPPEFRGDWRRVDAATSGSDMHADIGKTMAGSNKQTLQQEIAALISKSETAQGLTAAAKVSLAQEMLAIVGNLKSLEGQSGNVSSTRGSRILRRDAIAALESAAPAAPAAAPVAAPTPSRRGRAAAAKPPPKLVLPSAWSKLRAVHVNGYSRPNTSAYPWFGFYGLKESQEVRAGDTYAIDYVLHGFSSMASSYRKLAIVVQCNGTDFHWDGSLLKASVIGYHNTFLVDLPLGSHRLKAGLYVTGFKEQAIWTPEYTITVRRVRYSSAELTAGAESKLPSDWNDAPAGHCAISALCRILKDWQVAAEAAGMSNYFLTSYTLLGHQLWGWFMPWRGDHRWDRGGSSSSSRLD